MTEPLIQAKILLALGERLTVQSVSPEAESLLGFTSAELLRGKISWQERIHRADAPLAASLFSPDAKERSGDFNIRMRHADGRIRCFKGHFVRMPGRAGKAPILELTLADARTVREPGDALLAASFKTLIEQTSDFVYIKNRNHVILAASRTVPGLTLSAQSSEELAGKTDYDLHLEAMADVYYELEEKTIREGQRINQLLQVTAQDGGQRWIDNRKYPINGPDGKVIGIFGMAPDVTEYVVARERLKESEEQLRDAQEIAGVGSYVLDIPGMRWHVSPQVDAIMGTRADYGRSMEDMWDLVHPDDRPMMKERFAANFAGTQNTFDYEYRILRHSDGAVRWVHTLGRIETDTDGRPIAFKGTIQDITQRKDAEDALRQSGATLREVQRIGGLGSYCFDFSAGMWTSSDVMDEIFGIGRAYHRSIEGWAALVHPDDRKMMVDYFAAEVVGRGKPFDKEYRILRPCDGVTRWVHGLGRLECDSQNRPVKMLGTIRDITDTKLAQETLRQTTNLLQLFIKHAPAALAMLDHDMRYIAVSRRWLEIHGLTEAETIGRSHYEVLSEVPEEWREEHLRALAGEALGAREGRLVRANGSVQWLRREILPWRAGDGSVGGVVIFSEDVTAKKLTEERLQLAATVFTGAREGITITDPQGTILEVNDAFCRITGYSREEVLGQNPRFLKSGLQSTEFYDNMWGRLAREGHWSGEIWNRSKSGDIYPEMLTINALRDAGGNVAQYVALFTDITEIKEKQQQLEHIARYDALTGLPNRPLFADRLRQAMAHAHRNKQRLAVAYFDLDSFKNINDHHGQTVGDGLLTAVAFRMKRVMREGDTLARLGGDEFAAVMLDLDDAEAITPAMNRLLKAAADEAQIGEIVLRASASAGVTFYPQQEEVDADVLLRQAGQAMYQAKLAGKNRFHLFDPGEDLLARSRHEDIEHIRRALEARQFVLHYQPKVNMRTGKLVGAEALIRWNHPTRGLLPPGLFLPVIENHPLAIALGQWMIDAALTQMEAWQAAGLDPAVSVNVSADELQQPDFANHLRLLLANHPGVNPANLQLEVLETSALQDVVQTSQVLHRCRELGVTIALDDFGTGYSSLTYLKRLPANLLKIDQSFVRGILEEPENLTILEGVMGLATAFRLEVIAEGVETAEHGMMLLQLGCELAQGYGIARPMPGSELPAWIQHWQPYPRWADVPPMHAGNRLVVYAAVEHRAWLAAFEAYLQGKRSAPPPLGADRCRVGMWLNMQKLSARGTAPAIQAIERLHRQVHELAAQIDRLHAEGRRSESLAHLAKLHLVHDKCLSRLQTFARTGISKTGKSRGRAVTTARIGTE